MKLNKYILSAFVLASGAVSFTSCNDFLTEKPESMIGPSSLGDSKDAANAWVTGVYSNWLYDMFCWGEFPKVLELDADYITGPDWLFGSMGAGNFQAESSLDKMWKGPYNLINDANVAARYISEMSSISDDFKNNAIGECYFQEAFAYFLLVRAYGPIPYMATDVSNGGGYMHSRRPVAEIYEHIIDRLTKASEMLYHRDNSQYQTGHVSAGSAAGLLAKVYATMASAAMPAGTEVNVRTCEPYRTETVGGKEYKLYNTPATETFQKKAVEGYEAMDATALYEQAAKWAKKVIDGEFGPYELSKYDELWSRNHRDDAEMMWGVRSAVSSASDNYRTNIHTNYSGYKASAGSEFLTSGGWMGCSNAWYQLFDENDYRITKGVRHTWRYYYQEDYNGCFYYPQSWCVKVTGRDIYGEYVREPDAEYKATGYAYQYNQSSECLAFTTKYDDCENDALEYPDSYWPFLRYADVLLIYAEAENELGHQDVALQYLNKVRERSNAPLMETATSKTGMRGTILEERAKEFACEGDRRWDLIRWGIYLQAMNAIGGRDEANINKARTERNLLYPIPADEINVNDSISSNNPGWN